MPSIHIMTFNVQMLPWLGSVIEGQTNNAPDTADRVADAIFARRPGDRPDVIAFNEVFDEDGRQQLINRFASDYPHMIEKVDTGAIGNEDAGLMLVSKFPFINFDNGDDHIQHFFANGVDDDAHANKGVCLVQFNTPTDLTTVAFTHLQASYTSEDQYHDVRIEQLDIINNTITQAFRGDSGPHGQVIVMGDLNIRGDSGAVSGEWASVFDEMRTTLTEHYFDGWRAYMHPPGTTIPPDQGLSNIDFENPDRRQRLDYMCFIRNEEAVDSKLVPQHMFIRLRNQSDHFALEAIVQLQSPHCTPSDAFDLYGAPEVTPFDPSSPTTIRRQDVQFEFPGTRQWIYCKQPGTFTFWPEGNATIELYLQSDLSHPVQALARLDYHSLPGGLKDPFNEFTGNDNGETFVVREPFFVVAKTKPTQTGFGQVFMMEHRGESKETAIAMLLHQEVFSSFPAGQILGAEDTCWFQTTLPMTLGGLERNETFILDNPSGKDINATLIDVNDTELASSSGADAQLELIVPFIGGEQVWLKLQRSDQDITGVGVIWVSPLTFLDLDETIYVYINDESGLDWPGADEPTLTIGVDNVALYDGSWDDADTGERWPGLWEAIRDKANTILPGVTKVGFIGDISVVYNEPDIGASSPQVEFCPALGESEADVVTRVITLPVPDTVRDGTYSFSCVLRRYPS